MQASSAARRVACRPRRAGASPAQLAGFARAWDEIHALAREPEVFNFDKKALALAIFDRLAGAERAIA